MKRRALQAFQLGSVLVHVDDNPTLVIVPRGEEVYSNLPWYRVRSKEWLADLDLLTKERVRIMRNHGEARARLYTKQQAKRDELERRLKAEERQFEQAHQETLNDNKLLIDRLLEHAESFHVERNPVEDLPMIPFENEPEDHDDIPF